MTERDVNPGGGVSSASTYAGAGNPARDAATASPSNQQSAAAGIKEKASEDWQTAKSAVRAELDHATKVANETASHQKNFAAERVSGLASAIEKVGAELEQGEQPEIGRYARQIGSTVQRFAGDMKDKDMGQIAAMAEDFGRRQPAAFLGIAALAGFAASRFLTASANRHSASPPQGAEHTSTSQSAPSAAPVSPAAGMGYRTGYTPGGNYNG